jgi:hypothetical protein
LEIRLSFYVEKKVTFPNYDYMCDKHSRCLEANQCEGKYANYFKVGQNSFEIILDFGQFYSEDQEAKLHTRIVTSPAYAKELLDVLRVSIEQHEKFSEHN